MTHAAGPRNELWAEILRARVRTSGEVAYRSLAEHDTARLAEYLASLAEVEVWNLDPDTATAFWINAHNAMVVLGVIHGGDPETIAGRARLYHWLQLDLAGTLRSPDEIEDLLAPVAAADPRIHFALSNATRSGPVLAPEPYTGDRLDALLAVAARRFVGDPSRNRFDLPARKAALSPIFEWHRRDFERAGGSLLGYASRFVADPKEASILRRPEMSLEILEFDWRLNAADGERPF